MPLPRSSDALRLYRCALQRSEEANILLDAGKFTGAVYLAGYGVECVLKALILEGAPTRTHREVMLSFQGRRAHDYDWLRAKYWQLGGPRFPKEVAKQFVEVDAWSTDLRYVTRSFREHDAVAFVKSAKSIIEFATGRF